MKRCPGSTAWGGRRLSHELWSGLRYGPDAMHCQACAIDVTRRAVRSGQDVPASFVAAVFDRLAWTEGRASDDRRVDL